MPAVAGHFYPGGAAQLKSQIHGFGTRQQPGAKALGIVVPHAGYIYSGRVAASVYNRIAYPDTFIVIGPNHTGMGAEMALFSSGEWEIPGRTVHVNEELSSRILASDPLFENDEGAHMYEHSLEVQIPFIAYGSESARIVPITVRRADLQACRRAGEAIARSVAESGCSTVIAASSDMNHYLDHDTTIKLDQLAIDMILALDPEGLYRVVMDNDISMCGVLPVVIMLYAAKASGAQKAELVMHTTSGEVSGDYDKVVGYAGMIVQ
ncbi:MAG: AmmeMemoRadiSam system protein B [Nitrospiraceae bacterium]|nr:AmmeMemoRadiSam system protein B [Nitrospiraceae bacterium]